MPVKLHLMCSCDSSIVASNFLVEAARWMSGYQPYAACIGLSAVLQARSQKLRKAARWTEAGGRGDRLLDKPYKHCVSEGLIIRREVVRICSK